MADRDDRPTVPLDHEPLNREERRRRQFGRGRPAASSGAAGSAGAGDPGDAADATGGEERPFAGQPDARASTGRPDQDVTHQTGAGTGGATEPDGRLVHQEGMHLPNRPNG
ncbi:MAG TPA: hypothetical protein VFK54_09475 [Candidatus Limnocylindrales bacterium]|nr:hypothetical protein [Candidatus Limnocylindrales bacterium]